MTNRDVVRNALGRTGECPELGDLSTAMEMPVESQQRRSAQAHLSQCARCRTELSLLREFESGELRPNEKDAVEAIASRLKAPAAPRSAARKRAAWLWSAPGFVTALGLAAALIVTINVGWKRPVETPAYDEQTLRSTRLRAIAPIGDVASVPAEFRWTPVKGAARYTLTVTEVDRTVVFRNEYTQTYIPTPEPVRSILQPGKTLQWTVTAEDSSGAELATTGVQQFRTKVLQSN